MSEESLIITLGVKDSNASTQIKALNKELKSLDSQYKLAKTGGDGFEKSLSGLGTKLTLLNSKYDANKAKLTAYKTQLDKAKEGVTKKKEELEKLKTAEGDNTAAIQKAEKQLATYQQQMHSAENAIKETEASMENLTSEINTTNSAIQNFKIKQFGESLQSAGDKMINLGNGMQATGTTLMKLSAPFVAIGGLAVKSAIDFESAFTGVVKTVDATDEQLAELRDSILEMSKVMPESASEIASVAEAAGQLGIKTENIESFTKTMVMLGDATNLSSDEAATSLARLVNITGMSQENFQNLGSSIVALGNNFATTEAEITAMSLRLAGAGAQVGMSEADIAGLAAALSSVGIEAEAGGSAFSKVMVNMQLATETGGESLEEFAKVAGMSADEFKTAFKDNAAGAITSFITGLSKCEENGTSAIKVLDDMGITEVRLRDALLRASGASDVFSEAIALSNTAWNENTALTKEAETRYATMQSQIEMCKNKLVALGIEIGEQLMPYVSEFIDGLEKLVDWFGSLDSSTQKFIITSGLMTFATGGVLKVVGSLTTGVGGLIKGLGNLVVKYAATTTATTALGTATSTASAGATVATASLGTLAAATAPLVIGIAAVGAALYTAHEYNDLYSDSIIKSTDEMSLMEIGLGKLTGATMYSREELENMGAVYKNWNDKVSPETQKELEDMASKFRNLQYEMDVINLDGVISQDEVKQLVSRTEEMCSEIVQAIKNHQDPAYQAMYELFMQDGAIDAAEQAMLDSVTKGTESQIAEVQAGKDRINEIYQNAANENRSITEDEQIEIAAIQFDWQQVILENLTLSQEEREAAIREFNVRCTTETTEGLSEIIQAETKSHEESKQALIDKYESQIALMKEQLPNLEGAQKAEVEARIKQYEEAYKLELENEQTLYDDKIALLNEKYPEMMQFIDKYTGEILSKQDVKCNKEFEKEKNKYDDINQVTESGLYRMYNKTTDTYDDLVVMVDEKTGDVIGITKTWTDEQGMHTEKVTGYNEKVKGSMQSMQEEYVLNANRIKLALSDQKNTTVNANGEIVNSNGKVVGSLQDIKNNADGTKTGILNLNGTPIKVQVNKDGTISNIDEIKRKIGSIPTYIPVTVKAIMTGNVSIPTGNGGRWTMEEGGTVSNDAVVYTNEKHAGFELIEGGAVELLSDDFGSVTALSSGARVYNNMTSIDMMKEEISRQLSQVDFGSYYSRNTAQSKRLVSNYNNSNATSNSQDTSKMESLMLSMVQLLERLNNKNTNIYMNTRQVGRVIAGNVDEELATKSKKRW